LFSSLPSPPPKEVKEYKVAKVGKAQPVQIHLLFPKKGDSENGEVSEETALVDREQRELSKQKRYRKT